MAIVLLPSYEVWRSNRGLSIVMDIPSTMWQIWPSVLAKEVISIIMLMTSDQPGSISSAQRKPAPASDHLSLQQPRRL